MNRDAPHVSYVVYNHNRSAVLYVGATNNLDARMKDHIRTQPWANQIGDVDFWTWPNRSQAFLAEYLLIDQHQPIHNIRKRKMPWQMRAALDRAEQEQSA